MTNNEKKELLNKEMRQKYSEYFKKERKQKFKTEQESIEYTNKFHKELIEYIEKRKEELEIEDSTK